MRPARLSCGSEEQNENPSHWLFPSLNPINDNHYFLIVPYDPHSSINRSSDILFPCALQPGWVSLRSLFWNGTSTSHSRRRRSDGGRFTDSKPASFWFQIRLFTRRETLSCNNSSFFWFSLLLFLPFNKSWFLSNRVSLCCWMGLVFRCEQLHNDFILQRSKIDRTVDDLLLLK